MLPLLKFAILGSEVTIPLYNSMIGLGIIIGLLTFEHMCSRQGIPKYVTDNLTVVIAFSLILGFISAALFDKFVHSRDLHEFFTNIFKVSGLTFIGGLLGGAIFFCVLYRIIMKNYTDIEAHLNCIAPSVVIAHSFGRIGCFFGGCCFGKPTNSVIGVCFPSGSTAGQMYGYGTKVIPTQLIEALYLLILFFTLYYLLQKYAFAYYLVFYGGFRFIIEYFRGDDRGVLFQTLLTPSQFFSAAMILVGGWLVYKGVHKRRIGM